MSKDVIKLEHVWKIFGENAQAAMQAIETRNLSKAQVLDEFKCVVGIADCSFSVKKGPCGTILTRQKKGSTHFSVFLFSGDIFRTHFSC